MKRSSMAVALNQIAGLPKQVLVPSDRQHTEPSDLRPNLARTPVPLSRAGKKPITGFFDPAVSKQIKKLALDQDATVQELVQEALNDLFRKNGLPPIA